MLGGIVVAYEFKRGKRRTIGFSVGADGLAVSAPKWVPLYEIDKSVLEKSGWILKKLQESRARHERLESARIEWKDGTTILFLGEPVKVLIDSRHAFEGWVPDSKPMRPKPCARKRCIKSTRIRTMSRLLPWHSGPCM
ncbi:M48 family metallopeptidase [Polaromonas sp. P2-4]|nr:M48 family metallopeptidase [Polaromonas sp. P2-4]